MSYLVELGISTKENKTTRTFESHFPHRETLPSEFTPAHEFVMVCWDKFKNVKSNSLRGGLFEVTLAMLFVIKKLTPFTMQARLELIPNVNYDFLFFTSDIRSPIVISAKTSLRERYKQAELEALALRNVFQNARSYLVTLDSIEVARRQKDLEDKTIVHLNDVVDASSNAFDLLLETLQNESFQEVKNIDILKATQVFVQETKLLP